MKARLLAKAAPGLRRPGLIAAALGLVLALAACAQTSSVGMSLRNERLGHLGPFDSVVIVVRELPPEERDLVERRLIAGLRDLEVEAVAASELAELDNAEIVRTFASRFGDEQPDTVLVVERDSTHVRRRYVPPQFIPGYSYPVYSGRFVTWIHVPATTIPGRWAEEEEGVYLAALLHVERDEPLWAAVVGAEGDDRAEWRDVTDEAVTEIIERLVADGAFDPSVT